MLLHVYLAISHRVILISEIMSNIPPPPTPNCWHLLAYVYSMLHVQTLWSLSGDIHWCLFYPLLSFDYIENLPIDFICLFQHKYL